VIILDTDHIVTLKYSPGGEYARLTANMSAAMEQQFVITTITVEEQLRGWLALINRSKDKHQHVSVYKELNGLIDYFARWTRLPFHNAATDCF